MAAEAADATDTATDQPAPAASAADSISAVQEQSPAQSLQQAQEQSLNERESTSIDGSVFGRRGGYFHPFLSLLGVYSDNILNLKDNRLGDYTMVVSPGIWIATPRAKEKILEINTSNVTPGGLMLSRDTATFKRRYQAYLRYHIDFERYLNYSDLDAESQTVEGFLQYNFRSGLSVDLIDQFKASQEGGFSMQFTDQYLNAHDDGELTLTTGLDEYSSNLVSTAFTYAKPGKKLNLRLDLSTYGLDFTDAASDPRDRRDYSLAAYGYYKFKPKTAGFINYEFIDIKYRTGDFGDSREHNLYGGLKWDVTEKTQGRVKTGFGLKDFSRPEENASSNWLFELFLDHTFSSKNNLKLILLRKTNETTSTFLPYVVTNRINASFDHKFTEKISGIFNFSYTRDQYEGVINFGNSNGELLDNIYSVAPMLRYKIKKPLTAEASYIYTNRNSSFSELDYHSNYFFVRVFLEL